MIKLTLTEKGGEPKVLTFDKDEITIGRVTGNDIVLAKGNISKRHTRLTKREGGGMEIADLKSTNGTYVNGRKIAGPTLVAPSDRIYVGDFLIGIDGPGAGIAEQGGLHSAASTTSASRRLPVPPPPPPPARGGSSAARLPEDDETSSGSDEEEEGLAARPPRAGRPIPPPPPPPTRRPTPLAATSLDMDEDVEAPFDDSPPVGMPQPPDDTGNVGLFQHTRRGGDDDEASSRRVPTGNRPGANGGIVSQAPAFGGVTGPTVSPPDMSSGGAAAGLEALLGDPAITQILITAPDAALIDRGSGLSLYDGELGDSNAVADVLWRYANNAYPPPPPDNPVVDVRLPDGTRVSAAFPPAAPGGVVASIRRTVLPERALVDLIPGGNKDVQVLLDALVATRRNVLVTGDAAAIPSVLGALGSEVPADRRVVAIAAAARSRSGWIDLAPAADPAGLARVAAALRPDHLVVGELSGPEAGELVLIATRGQNGILLAMPGRSASEAVTRLGALAAVTLGAASAPALVANAFDLYVHVVAADNGARIIEIGELRASGAELTLDVSLSLYGDGSKRDLANGRLQGRGVSSRLGASLAAAGSSLPAAMVGK
jgi:pilus assembly protein CpaF